jgi:hypothetical protein
MNPNQLALGAVLPFLLGGFFYLRRRDAPRSWLFFILWPGFMAIGALWAVIPDLPRLVGAHSLYLRLSQLPLCDIFFGHYTIDRIEFDSPLFLVAWFAMPYIVIAAALDALVLAEKTGEPNWRASEEKTRPEVKAPTPLHFAVGWLAVSLVLAPALWRDWTARRPMGYPLIRWVALSVISGVWAVIPSLCKRMGWILPDRILDLFWGYGWLSHSIGHAQIAGPILLTALLALQYGVIVSAYCRVVSQRK